MAVNILPGQNTFDAAILSGGSLEDLFAFCALNGLGITDDLPAGSSYQATGLTYQPSTGIVLPVSAVKASAVVLPRQCLLDMAMQESGSLEDLFNIAQLNGISITDALTPDAAIVAPVAPYNKTVAQLYSERGYRPASTDDGVTLFTPPQGIDYWIIENDFIVS